jgi:dolichyl-phosphate-mannose-protein mannosyltransferase
MPAQILWKVDIINRDQAGDIWHAITSQIRLVHISTGQALKFSGRQLPDWGFNQHEVVADRVLVQQDTVWNVEEHRHTTGEEEVSKHFLFAQT